MLCQSCYGSGQILGNGMMIVDCPRCDDYLDDCANDEVIVAPKKVLKIDKRSKDFRIAIDNIMKDGDISRDEAVEIFEAEFNKIDDNKE